MEYSTPEGSVWGHPSATGVIATGAINQGTPDTIASYSSQGPVRVDFPSIQNRPKPDICGIAGVSVTANGGFTTPFYGTSAAAPHIAAICAQIWSFDPDRTNTEIKNYLINYAVDLGSSSFDNVFGHGRADAMQSAGAASPPPTGKPTRSAISFKDRQTGQIEVTWGIGNSADPIWGIAGYYLEVGTLDEPDKYFGENVGDVFEKILMVPQDAEEVYARVKAINRAGIAGEFSGVSAVFVLLSVPTISTLTPSSGKPMATLDVSIQGGNFEEGIAVSFSGSGIAVNRVTFLASNTIKANITISVEAAVGNRDVTATNSDGESMTKSAAFEVLEGARVNAGQVKIQGGEKGYVNPSKAEKAKIWFNANSSGSVDVKIYTLQGQLLRELSKVTTGGGDSIEWDCKNNDGSTVSSGIYIVYIKGPGVKKTRKVAIVR